MGWYSHYPPSSYYYDAETGFYYLQSRYYDPCIGRFINSDTFTSTGQSFLGYNMFAYCGNNPINNNDPSGMIWHIAVGAGIGAVLGAVSSVVTQVVGNALTGKTVNVNWRDVGLAAVGGAISGGLAASAVGIVGQIVGNATVSLGNNVASQMLDGNSSFDFGSMLIDTAIGTTAGYFGGAGAGSHGLTKIGLTNVKRTANALINKGIDTAVDVLSRGITYFGKHATTTFSDLGKAFVKSTVTAITGGIAKALLY